jgi:ABC-type antimicrobial peptide transport system permease subunit
LAEAMLFSVVGWVIGLSVAVLLTQIRISTLSWTSLAEVSFGMAITPQIFLQTLLFALVMGFLGGFLPALRAARIKIVDALRAA